MSRSSRRQFLRAGAAAACALGGGCATLFPGRRRVEDRIEAAHAEIWRRFITCKGVMLDFTGLDGAVEMPTVDECFHSKPNALGWWTPIENGAFFTGLYLEAMLHRWRVTGREEAAGKVHRLAGGLVLLACVSHVKGFIARGVVPPGFSMHYRMGSDDQTLPWFYGMWRYLESGLPLHWDRGWLLARLTEKAEAIVRLNWRMPAEEPFGVRGGFNETLFYQAPRLLFVARMMHRVTGDARWESLYRAALRERGGKEGLSRLELCERGMVYDHGPRRHSWTVGNSVAALRALWEMEDDAAVRSAFARGLEASAVRAMESVPDALQLDPAKLQAFDGNWRKLNELWSPQKTEDEAVAVAEAQARRLGQLSPRRGQEFRYVREPAFAAWIATLAPDPSALRARAPVIERTLAHIPYEQLHHSQFFPVELAWGRIRLAEQA